MGRSPCCSKVGLSRGPWSTKEDTLLTTYIQQHGQGQWRSLPNKAGLLRCGKSCRLRWMNYLRPGVKKGNITQDEEDLIVRLHGLLGNRWSLISGRIPGRTDNEIKNYWNTHLLKKLQSSNPLPHKDIIPKKIPAKLKRKAAAEEQRLTDNMDPAAPKTKVYLPKPVRISPVFSRTSSYDSLGSGSEKAAEVARPSPLFEVEDFLGVGGRILPLLQQQISDSMSGDVNMWEKVYDEYLQLL